MYRSTGIRHCTQRAYRSTGSVCPPYTCAGACHCTHCMPGASSSLSLVAIVLCPCPPTPAPMPAPTPGPFLPSTHVRMSLPFASGGSKWAEGRPCVEVCEDCLPWRRHLEFPGYAAALAFLACTIASQRLRKEVSPPPRRVAHTGMFLFDKNGTCIKRYDGRRVPPQDELIRSLL